MLPADKDLQNGHQLKRPQRKKTKKLSFHFNGGDPISLEALELFQPKITARDLSDAPFKFSASLLEQLPKSFSLVSYRQLALQHRLDDEERFEKELEMLNRLLIDYGDSDALWEHRKFVLKEMGQFHKTKELSDVISIIGSNLNEAAGFNFLLWLLSMYFPVGMLREVLDRFMSKDLRGSKVAWKMRRDLVLLKGESSLEYDREFLSKIKDLKNCGLAEIEYAKLLSSKANPKLFMERAKAFLEHAGSKSKKRKVLQMVEDFQNSESEKSSLIAKSREGGAEENGEESGLKDGSTLDEISLD